MAIKAGTLASWSGSMAERMQQAFALEWAAVRNVPLPNANSLDMKILFSAIAQGIVRHLDDQQTSFDIVNGDSDERINLIVDVNGLRPPLNTDNP